MTETTEADVIGVTQYLSEDSTYFFGCRGYGSRYHTFYKWLNARKLLMDHLDWPWHYFTFKDIADEQAMIGLSAVLDLTVSIRFCWDDPAITMLSKAPYTPASRYH